VLNDKVKRKQSDEKMFRSDII